MYEYKLHITSTNQLSLSAVSELFSNIDIALNNIKRSQGVKSNVVNKGENATIIESVEKGSIILNLLLNFVVPVAVSVVADIINTKLQEKRRKNDPNITVTYTVNIIEIHIDD